MNAAITNAERCNARPLITCESAERHKANAAEWYRQYLRYHRGELEPGADPEAIWSVYARECDMAGLEPIAFAATVADAVN